MRRLLNFADQAQTDIDAILSRSLREHGLVAAERYDALLRLAFDDLAERPNRTSAKRWKGGPLWLYALRHIARRLKGDAVVRGPPHIVVYVYDNEMVTIIRLVHEAMDLPPILRRLQRGSG